VGAGGEAAEEGGGGLDPRLFRTFGAKRACESEGLRSFDAGGALLFFCSFLDDLAVAVEDFS
jgi:hypothetical protein